MFAAAASSDDSALPAVVYSCEAEDCGFSLRFRAGDARPAFPLAAHTADCILAQCDAELNQLETQRRILAEQQRAIDAQIEQCKQQRQRAVDERRQQLEEAAAAAAASFAELRPAHESPLPAAADGPNEEEDRHRAEAVSDDAASGVGPMEIESSDSFAADAAADVSALPQPAAVFSSSAAASSPAKLTPQKRDRENEQEQRAPSASPDQSDDDDAGSDDDDASASKVARIVAHAFSPDAIATAVARAAAAAAALAAAPSSAAAALHVSPPAAAAAASFPLPSPNADRRSSEPPRRHRPGWFVSAPRRAALASNPVAREEDDEREEEEHAEEEKPVVPQKTTRRASAPAAGVAAVSSPARKRRRSGPAVAAAASSSSSSSSAPASVAAAAAAASPTSSALPSAVAVSRRPASHRFQTVSKRELGKKILFNIAYGRGPLIEVRLVFDYYRLPFEALFERAVAEGFFSRDHAKTTYADDADRSEALRFLYFYSDNHARFSESPRILLNEMEYMPLRQPVEVVLIGGEPWITVLAVHQTLMQLPALSDSEFKARAAKYKQLWDAIEPAYSAQMDVAQSDVTMSSVRVADPALDDQDKPRAARQEATFQDTTL